MFPKISSHIAASYAVAVLFVALASCSKQKEDATSTFTGKVILHDEFGNALNDNSGVTVSLYEKASIQTTTALDGSFSLSRIPMGESTLKVEKKIPPVIYGTYYTKIKVDTPNGTITMPINVGQVTEPVAVQYTWDYSIDPSKTFIVFSGTRIQTSASDNLKRYHRIFFDFSTPDGYPNLHAHRYSIGPFKNNLSTGFVDTVRLAGLRNKFVGRRGALVAIAPDNPKADSCIVPYVQYDMLGKPIYSPGVFVNSYPAIGLPAYGRFHDLFTNIIWD